MLTPYVASAVVIGDSNLGVFGYPEPTCTKPIRPHKPYSYSSKYEIDSYNSQVALFNSEMDEYIRCVKRYLDAANNDIDAIKEKMTEAVNRAKSPY